MNEDSLRYRNQRSLNRVLPADTIPSTYAFALSLYVDKMLAFPDIASSDIACCKRLFWLGLCKE